MEVDQAVKRAYVLPPVPTILNIGQFLGEPGGCVWMQQEWLLVYAHALQHMVEAMTGCCWLNKMPKPSIRVTDLAKVFMNVTKVQHLVVSVTCCWMDPPSRVPYQHDIGQYT